MFPKHARFMTRGVSEAIGPDLQNALWSIIDKDLDGGKPMDYLQVFTLTIVHAEGQTLQRVRHKQEQPERKRKYDFSGIKAPVSGITVWIIDSSEGEYCTMLLPEEY